MDFIFFVLKVITIVFAAVIILMVVGVIFNPKLLEELQKEEKKKQPSTLKKRVYPKPKATGFEGFNQAKSAHHNTAYSTANETKAPIKNIVEIDRRSKEKEAEARYFNHVSTQPEHINNYRWWGDEKPSKANHNPYPHLSENHTQQSGNPPRKENVEKWLDDGRPVYIGRSHLMTETERRFYNFICQKFNPRSFHIFAQVRVMDILMVNWKECRKGSFEEKVAFNQMGAWHVDYLVTDKNFKIMCAIELDDPSHEREDRKRRDKILNAAFKVADIKLIRYKLMDFSAA